jgi:nucleoside-diphosphate-sugar epimerase
MRASKEKFKKTVLVTGGAGYVGSILLRRLLQRGFRVVCADMLRFGGESLLEIWDHPDFIFQKIDVTEPHAVDALFEQHPFFAVVHLAAIVGDPACRRESDLAVKTNRDASIHLLQAAIAKKVERFVFASTCSNYGKMADPHAYVDEASPLAPVSLYAELKVEFEKILLNKAGKPRGFAPTSLRFATVYGLSPRMRFDLTVNEFTKELALGRELQVFGEQFWRPYCHVSDFSNAMLAVLRAPRAKVAFNVFNVGDTSENYTKKMIVEEIAKQIPSSRIKYVEKKDDPRDYRVRFEKIQRELGFTISKTVPDGIREIYSGVQHKIVSDPDDQKYYNIPVAPKS